MGDVKCGACNGEKHLDLARGQRRVPVDSLEAIKDRHDAWMAGVENGKASASVVFDENAEFEKWRNTQIDVLIRNGYLEGAVAFRNLGSVQGAGWQARSYLDKVKELDQ